MTWKHSGKTSATENINLNWQCAQDNGIQGMRHHSQVQIYKQALDMLATLNGFDQEHILKDIREIQRNPHSSSSTRHSRWFFKRVFRSRIPFKNYHFEITYNTTQGVVIEDIWFDYRLYGSRGLSSLERTIMYLVSQRNNSRYDGAKTRDEIDSFADDWSQAIPVPYAKTTHITVNGMQNNLKKAGWLMGVHTQAAYPKDGVNKYTLFHNPSDGFSLDLIECLYDTLPGRKSHNAQHLASVITQQANKPTKWTVHSQGAIIFLAALKEYKKQGGARLTSHHLAIHAPGANVAAIKSISTSLGIKVLPVKSNPFDLVPNILGRNNLSRDSLGRCIAFSALLKGDDAGASPHTLPYLGIETYREQLKMLGQHEKANLVQKYIDKNCL